MCFVARWVFFFSLYCRFTSKSKKRSTSVISSQSLFAGISDWQIIAFLARFSQFVMGCGRFYMEPPSARLTFSTQTENKMWETEAWEDKEFLNQAVPVFWAVGLISSAFKGITQLQGCAGRAAELTLYNPLRKSIKWLRWSENNIGETSVALVCVVSKPLIQFMQQSRCRRLSFQARTFHILFDLSIF